MKVYTLWGEAVDLAHRVHDATRVPGVFVSDRVHDAVDGIYRFSPAATMAGRGRQLLYAQGELIQPVRSVPQSVGFITAGVVGMIVYADDGRELSLGRLGVGDYRR